MAGIGHNGGPELSGALGWRRYAWGRARADLLPVLPIEILRRRVIRAQELGLPYKTYAGVRAASGRDVIGFLFSSNALRLIRAGQALPADRMTRLSGLINADRTAVLQWPLTADDVALMPLDAAYPAPRSSKNWAAMRDQIRDILRDRQKPADGFLVVGETFLERDWAEAGKTAGFLTGARYFEGGAG
jgi:hypothetical protein